MVCRDLIHPPSREEMEYHSDMSSNNYGKMLTYNRSDVDYPVLATCVAMYQ
jgi:hypothetical protein